MKKRYGILGVFIFLFAVPAYAQAPAEIEIIFDASRSMNDAMQNSTRLVAAKQALSTIVGQISPETKVGLRVFGATPVRGNIQQTCSDSRLMVPISPINANQMIGQVMSLQAHGQTPIGFSLEQSARDFTPAADVKKTVILISDGEESCGKDPSSVIQLLQQQGIDIVVHTIGFDVDEAARGQLKKLADISGGTYADAGNAAELTKELTQVAESTMLLSIQRSGEHNILSAAEGTRLVSSSTQTFAKMIDGKEEVAEVMYPGQEAIFSFRDGQGVRLKKFAVPVFKIDNYNPGTFTLLGSLESPETGYFPVAEFTVKNQVFFDNVYQEFSVDPPVALQYLKVIVGPGSTGNHSYHTEWKAYGDYLSAEELGAAIAGFAAKEHNVLAAEHGGQLIAASDMNFKNAIDGVGTQAGNSVSIEPPKEGIFGFKEGKTAQISKIAVPVYEASDKNCKTFEFSVSTASPTSGYQSVGTFQTMNMVFAGNPFQEYVFDAPMDAKYLKISVTETHGMYYCHLHEVQAFGTLKD